MDLEKKVGHCLPFVTKIVLGSELDELNEYLSQNKDVLPTPRYVEGKAAVLLIDPADGNYCNNEHCKDRTVRRTIPQINAPETDIVICNNPCVVDAAYQLKKMRYLS